jgi:hypothetical protein
VNALMDLVEKFRDGERGGSHDYSRSVPAPRAA